MAEIPDFIDRTREPIEDADSSRAATSAGTHLESRGLAAPDGDS